MTPAEHREKAAYLASKCEEWSDEFDAPEVLRLAQLHATLALTPPPPPVQPPPHRMDINQRHEFLDAQIYRFEVWPTEDRTAVLIGDDKAPWLFENPDVLRTLASLLTAHADRLEFKP